MRSLRDGLGAALIVPAGAAAATAAYLLVLLGAGAIPRRATDDPEEAPGGSPWKTLVLIPAHDEEVLLADTLATVGRLERAGGALDVTVVADHCGDETVPVARAAGVRVLDRRTGVRGKGQALAWALAEFGERLDQYDAVVFLDADTRPAVDLLTVMGACMRAGADIVQVDNRVSNAAASTSSGLRDAGFRLMNTIRPLGKTRLGLSAGLRGTGMAFRPAVLRRHGWPTASFVEDFEQHLALVAAGQRVWFTDRTSVQSPMPTSLDVSRDQELRWESARVALLRRWSATLLVGAVRHRDLARADAIVDLLVPPQSLLLGANLLTSGLAASLRARTALRLALLATFGQLTFVLVGLRVAGAPATTFRALLWTPRLVLQKLGIASTLLAGRGPRDFSRTPREPRTDVRAP